MIKDFLNECKEALDSIDTYEVQCMASIIERVRDNGRLFIIGSGGGAGHASHAVCDFRKLCGVESHSIGDNVCELTARINDDGWDQSIVTWLRDFKFNSNDCLFVFSVGGGSETVSLNLSEAIIYAHEQDGKIIGIVGRKECTLTEFADAWVLIKSSRMTPVVEGLQSVIAHLLVTMLQIKRPVW